MDKDKFLIKNELLIKSDFEKTEKLVHNLLNQLIPEEQVITSKIPPEVIHALNKKFKEAK